MNTHPRIVHDLAKGVVVLTKVFAVALLALGMQAHMTGPDACWEVNSDQPCKTVTARAHVTSTGGNFNPAAHLDTTQVIDRTETMK